MRQNSTKVVRRLVIGFVLLYFAPGQRVRYKKLGQDYSPIETLLDLTPEMRARIPEWLDKKLVNA